ncbi:hypothetical protein GCM10010435_42090 [Winogradskya consettensis]|uniref:Uncharacterized protein n=1 Tax=Winogradskya consettensis TaxID=113560 RepID=A0A919SQU1_9ACTN|nr:hypothetical protein [Actinoplanes consettensis]GIM76726.1 hypothetical protein Aco04nite_51790 [Actinoplanes consettensis]
MLFLLVATLVLGAMCVLPFMYGWQDVAATKRRGMTEDKKESESKQPWQPESLEGVLVAQLMGAEITLGQYSHEMAKIAARDDERHPLSIPPEQGAAGV